jgi:hypothetical protein
MGTVWHVTLVGATLLAVLLGAGCGDDGGDGGDARTGSDDGPTGAFAGPVEGSDAYVGIFVDVAYEDIPREAFAFVTDGDGTAEWFNGYVESGTTNLTSDDGAELTFELTDDAATGVFDAADGDEAEFAAVRVEPPAGLYEGSGSIGDDEVTGGAVLLADGTSRAALLREDEVVPATVTPVRGNDQQLDLAYGDAGDTWRVTAFGG